MLDVIIDRGHRVIAGGVLLGEIGAFLTDNRIQQVGLLLTGIAAWASHFIWSQRRERRKDHDDAEASRRTNALLDAVTERLREDVKAGRPLSYPEFSHLLVDEHRDEKPE